MIIFQLIVLIFSIMIHEISHGAAALSMGDPTAKLQGRLTLNPLKHIDPMGSIILPVLLVLVRSPILFGWAKPVPYNPYNLHNQKWGPALVGLAGPASNLAMALMFGLLIRFFGFLLSIALIELFSIIVFINILLAVFNLVPIPPLDGSKILYAILPHSMNHVVVFLETYGFYILIIFILFGLNLIYPIIFLLFNLITGI